MIPSRWQWLPIGVFVLLVVPCTWLSLAISRSRGGVVFIAAPIGAALFPALFVLLVCLLFPNRKASFQQLGMHKPGQLKWYGFALIQPTSMVVVGYLVSWATGLIKFAPDMATINASGGPLPFIITLFILAIGEEVGWRGFLQPRLTQLFDLRRALPLTGLVWVVWHYSFLIWTIQNDGSNPLINTLLFTIGLVLVDSTLIGWVRAGSQSLWPAVIWHMTWNVVWFFGLQIFSVQHLGWTYIGNDSGIVPLLVGALIIFWVWRRRSAASPLPDPSLSARAIWTKTKT